MRWLNICRMAQNRIDMKQSIVEAAKEYADRQYGPEEKGVLYQETINDFQCGAEWRESQIPEHISTVQDCELAVKDTKDRAIEILSKVLENWVYSGDADCIIAEFEEKLNKGQ